MFLHALKTQPGHCRVHPAAAYNMNENLQSPQAAANAYFSPSWTAFQADRGRCFSLIVDAISAGSWTMGVARKCFSERPQAHRFFAVQPDANELNRAF